jgi:RND superfamily putative drug exporter
VSVWWLPKWLDRILPRVDVEGEALSRRPVGAVAAVPGPAPDPDPTPDEPVEARV